MFSRTPRGGHRPAESLTLALPPTLQPHAIHAMAPALDRRTSAALSGLIYIGLVGGMFILGRATHVMKLIKVDERPPVLFEDSAKPPVQAHVDTKPVERQAKGNPATRPEHAPTYTPSDNQVSDTTPSTSLSTDLSTAYRADLPIGPAGQTGPVGDPNSTSDVGTRVGPPINVDITALHILNQVTPLYPPMAKMAHLQGDVVLHMVIDGRGVPISVSVVQGPPQFHAEALRAAQQWRFTPARVNGEAVDAAFNLTLQFRLR